MSNSTLKDIASELPLKDAYQDLVHPSAVAFGKTVSLPFRAVNVLLAPIAKWILQGEAKLEAVSQLVAKEVENVPEEKLVPPEPYVAVPAFQAISYSLDSDELRDMYAKLLATAINTETKSKAHPAYVEMIKQLSPLDCRVLRDIAMTMDAGVPVCSIRFQETSNMPCPELPSFRDATTGIDLACDLVALRIDGAKIGDISVSIGNLKRLGFLDNGSGLGYRNLDIYKVFETHAEIIGMKERLASKFEEEDWELALIRDSVRITPLGKSFSEVCIGAFPDNSLYH